MLHIRRRNRESGFSLIEIMVALGVMATLVSGLVATMAAAQRSQGFNDRHQAASDAASKRLDEILTVPDITTILRETSGNAGCNWNSGPAADTSFPPHVGTDVESYAFDVTWGDTDIKLIPADASFLALNPGSASSKVGHVQIDELDDYDGDGWADYIEIRVIVAWKDPTAGDTRIDLLTRRVK